MIPHLSRSRVRCARRSVRLPATLALILSPVAATAATPHFLVDTASPSVMDPSSNDDVLTPGPIGGPPVGDGVLGVPAVNELDAFASLDPPAGTRLYFSVDRGATGATSTDVASEATAGQEAGDLYLSLLAGDNALAFNQDVLGLQPPTPAGVPATPPIDDVVGLAFENGFFFSLVTGHSLVGLGGVGCGGDLFGIGPTPLFGFADLGLGSCSDDLDALHVVFDGPDSELYFSLAPGSPSLLPGSPIGGCAAGCSPADVFVSVQASGSASLFTTASDLGLEPADDVDALAFGPGLPEVPALSPAGLALLAVLLWGFARRKLA